MTDTQAQLEGWREKGASGDYGKVHRVSYRGHGECSFVQVMRIKIKERLGDKDREAAVVHQLSQV